VLVVEVDVVHAETLQRRVAGLADVLRAAVDPEPAAVLASNVAELRRELHLVAAAVDGLPDEPLVGERAVRVGGVQEGDADVEGPLDGLGGLELVGGPVELAHPHAAQPESRDGEGGVAGAERAGLCQLGHRS
jgi:hypothetical protein